MLVASAATKPFSFKVFGSNRCKLRLKLQKTSQLRVDFLAEEESNLQSQGEFWFSLDESEMFGSVDLLGRAVFGPAMTIKGRSLDPATFHTERYSGLFM
jgi:hypothetical protein